MIILSSFSYKTYGWELVEMNNLQPTNLLVGKNASGKTRTIKAIQDVTSFMQMKSSSVLQDSKFRTKMIFSNSEKGWEMIYIFEIDDKKVVYEQLTVCGKVLVARDANRTEYNGVPVNPPMDKLVVQVRRDSEAFPEVEELMKWAEGVVVIYCSNINPYTIFNVPEGLVNPVSFSDLVDSLTKKDKKSVIDEAKQLGYNIKDISLVKAVKYKFVTVKEAYVRHPIFDVQLSNGMIRVLFLLCFMKSMKYGKQYSMLLIDDLGEGMDYSRATLLGKKIFETCEKEGVQMIASSNDAFLMDVVDISKWQILRRKNTKLTVLNQMNTPEVFHHFRMTGLSNFDLFSSDFIDNFLAKDSR